MKKQTVTTLYERLDLLNEEICHLARNHNDLSSIIWANREIEKLRKGREALGRKRVK